MAKWCLVSPDFKTAPQKTAFHLHKDRQQTKEESYIVKQKKKLNNFYKGQTGWKKNTHHQ